jgi:cyclophilin family peptidyl-prolyl cis-trans isomerase
MSLPALHPVLRRTFFAFLGSVALASCGGGGGDAGTTELPTVASASASNAEFEYEVLVEIRGARLDAGLTLTSTGCANIKPSSTRVSSATTAYYTCNASVIGAQNIAIARSIDNLNLFTAAFTVSAATTPPPTVSNATVGAAMYSQPVLVTIDGTNLDTRLAVASAGCKNMARSTTAPYVSSVTTAYYTCTASRLGAQAVTVGRAVDPVILATANFTVPAPQVTMTVSNTPGVLAGSMVFTLAPDKAPITVDNFLRYVNTGFYDGTIFHRVVDGFVVQGGGFLANGSLKTPTFAPIPLEKGLSNLQWTLAMARTDQLNSASSQFFINTVDNQRLDNDGGGYAAFGIVTTNTGLVAAIESTCPTSNECLPNPAIVITSATQSR